MSTEADQACDTDESRLLSVLKEYWGYDRFLPLQREAMICALAGTDSLTVLPTGGGKSLCYQAPALCRDGLTLVISPLISLMKDQVDSLRACGVEADLANSSQSREERLSVEQRLRTGTTRLLYLAPERLVAESTLSLLCQLPIAAIAVDEAHCISAWGHDFRPEYRRLESLREWFPDASIHAFTATATELVRTDIVRQLRLVDPTIHVGQFDRPNLFYRVAPRRDRLREIVNVIRRHPDESGIVYCISRADVETIAKGLNARGYSAAPYHAGLEDSARKQTQDEFIHDRVNTIVATVAFGMGIDKPDVRYVIHGGMPKSLENYQQETGRAGRDGLESECVLFYAGKDFHVWKSLIESSDQEPQALSALSAMYDYCSSVVCRHRMLSNHFGQDYASGPCGACDVCNGDVQILENASTISQMILSCVARLGQRFGGEYTSLVLAGSSDERIRERGHDSLSTYGLLSQHDRRTIRGWIEQLVDQSFLVKAGEYNVLEISATGRVAMRGEVTPILLEPNLGPRSKTAKRSAKSNEPLEGVDLGLFAELRNVRKRIATDAGVPAYIVFGDRALQAMAAHRPSDRVKFLEIPGVGQHKLEKFGDIFLDEINRYCAEHSIEQDVGET